MVAFAAAGGGVFDETEQPPLSGKGVRLLALPATGPAAAPWPRLQIPSPIQQAQWRNRCKEVFAQDLADHSAGGRRAQAEKLLKDAGSSRDAAERYVLITAARQAAIELADLSLCYRTIEALAAVYEVDAARLKLDVALKVIGKSESAAVTAENCRLALSLIDALVSIDDLPGAIKLGGGALASASGDPLLAALVERRVRECESIKTAREQLGPALEKLKTSADDAGANLAVGTFLCFARDDWGQGLPMVARGLDQRLRQLAQRELSRPQEAEAIAQLADDWWEWGQRQTEPAKTAARKHAIAAYGGVVGRVSGLRKAAIDKRLAEAAHLSSAKLLDLMPLAEPKTGSVHGSWSREPIGGGLLSPTGIDQFSLPYEPPEEYIFRVEFTRLKGTEGVGLIAAKGATPFTWTVGMSHGEAAGIDAAKNKPVTVSENPTRVMIPAGKLESNRRCVSTIEVRNGRVRGWLDGRLLLDWKTDYRDLGPHDRGNWAPVHPGQLGLCTWNSQTVFHRIEVLEITGEGKIVK